MGHVAVFHHQPRVAVVFFDLLQPLSLIVMPCTGRCTSHTYAYLETMDVNHTLKESARRTLRTPTRPPYSFRRDWPAVSSYAFYALRRSYSAH